MTDKLIVLNNSDERVKEGFIKLEDGKYLTIAFLGEKGDYRYFIDGKIGDFNFKNHCKINFSAIPKNAGIFLINGDIAYLMLFYGDKEKVKSEFSKLANLTIGDFVNVSVTTVTETKTEAEQPEINKEPAYKETGYVLPENFIQPPEEIPNSFFDCNKEKFNEILYNNPANESLMDLIPESKWVDVEDENHTFGIIYDENNVPLYICYGFKLGWSEEPPEKLEGYCQWIPLDCADPRGDGIWVIYINAQTGERLK